MLVKLLGPVAVQDESGATLDIGGPKQRTVLAVLAANVGESVSTDLIAEALWGDRIPDRAARSISTYVSNLRRVMGDVIDSDARRYTLNLPRGSVDAAQFLDAIRGPSVAGDRVAVFRDALRSFHGMPIDGIESHGVLRDFTTQLIEARLAAEKVVVAHDLDHDASGSISKLDSLVVQHPLDENLRGLHMRALYRAGRQADALESYSEHRDNLRDELGLDPSEELQDLELSILRHEVDGAPGEQDLRRLVHANPAPMRYSSFVGREREAGDVLQRLSTHRLVSIVGPGGIGKSSLAAEVADNLSNVGTVAWASLEGVAAEEVALAVARAVGLEPSGSADPTEAVVRYVVSRPHVIVLDGCEAHIIEASRVCDELLRMSDLHIVATSREPLGLNGESTIRLDPLELDEAVRVFVDRAELADTLDDETLAVVHHACAAVDGMPLAIELAASRARTVPLDRLAQRMSDQIPLLRRSRSFDERHGSLLAALDWSFELLEPSQQSTLLALSVFRSPFTMAEALSVSEEQSAEDDLSRLVEVSLVQPSDASGAFRLLEPVRQYAAHRSDREGVTPDIRRRHVDLMVRSAQDAARDQWTHRASEVWSWIFDRRDEMLRAMRWSLERGDPGPTIEIIAALGRRLVALGAYRPFAVVGAQAVVEPAAEDCSALSIALTHLGWMSFVDGRVAEGVAYVDRGLEIARSTGNFRGQGEALMRRSAIAHAPQDNAILTDWDEAWQLLRASGAEPTDMWLNNRAQFLVGLGRIDEAVECAERLLQWWRTTLGTPCWPYMAIMALVAEARADDVAALGHLRDAARAAEVDRSYRHVEGYWAEVALLADQLGRASDRETAVHRCREVREILGVPPHPEVELIWSVAHGRNDDALREARRWIDVVTAWYLDEAVLPGVRDATFLGTSVEPPAIFRVLRHIALAFHASGRDEVACRIACSVPTMLRSSRYSGPRANPLLTSWDELFVACACDEWQADPLTLETVFSFLVDVTQDLAIEGAVLSDLDGYGFAPA